MVCIGLADSWHYQWEDQSCFCWPSVLHWETLGTVMTSLEVGGQGPGQPPGRTDDFSDCKFSQPQTFKHILSDTSSEIGEIGDGLQPIILSRITFIKSPQMSVPERGQTDWLPLFSVGSLFQFFPLPVQWPSLSLSPGSPRLKAKLTITHRARNCHFSSAFLHILLQETPRYALYSHY